MITPERIAAFVEYVLRPLTDDLRQILDRLEHLVPVNAWPAFRQGLYGLAIAHLIGEGLRAITYIVIVWLVCQTLPKLLCLVS